MSLSIDRDNNNKFTTTKKIKTVDVKEEKICVLKFIVTP